MEYDIKKRARGRESSFGCCYRWAHQRACSAIARTGPKPGFAYMVLPRRARRANLRVSIGTEPR